MDDQNQGTNDQQDLGNTTSQMPASIFGTPPSDDSQAAPADQPMDQPISDNPAGNSSSASLQDIKSQAISQLTPLINHLDQAAEEKFKTLLMLIQSSDNQDLIQDAYQAAEQISDEKLKAQALLDIVNEINYFTQHQAS